ncbi:MAG: STAS/SEC14 domain-containing protein [Georgfuchsia sp.]
MISIDHKEHLVTVAVFGEFTLGDFKEFETLMSGASVPLNLLFDLRNMADFTVDVAWEEIKFARAHGHDFGKIAVLCSSQWVTWSAWLTRAIGDVELEVFESLAEAEAWLTESP